MRRNKLLALTAGMVLVGGSIGTVAAVSASSSDTVSASCTPSPDVTYGSSDASVSVTCLVPLPPPETTTVTETATVTETPTPTTTTSTTATSTTSTTTTPPTTTTTTSAGTKPTDANTGIPDGTVLKPYTGNLSVNVSNVTYDGYDFPGFFKVTGSNVTIKNSNLGGGFVFYGPGPLLIENSDGSGVLAVDSYYRDISGVVIDGYRGVMGSHDGMDLFASANGKITDVTIKNTFLDGQDFSTSSTSHGDGIQGRGVHGLKVLNTVVDLGPNQPQKNAALYLETAYYGLDDILVQDVWLDGGGYTFYTGTVTNALAQRVRIGPTHRYAEVEKTRTKGWVFDDVTDANGNQLTAP